MLTVLEQLANSALSLWIRESTEIYAYTLILTLHAIGLAIVVGVSTAVALRLLGKLPDIPLASARRFFGVIYLGFWVNAFSGALLFIAEPVKMAQMPAFWLKLFLIACGMVVNRRIQVSVLGDAQLVASNRPDARSRKLAWTALTCWYLALIVGRLTGYPEMVGQALKAIGL